MKKHLFVALATLLTFVGPVECAIRRGSIEKLVMRIQRADYEGDRAELQRLYEKLRPVEGDVRLASRVRYWRGFALWRRAFNGFNVNADPKDLERDMTVALAEFDEAVRLDPSFVDAKVGQISCGQTLAFLNRDNPEKLNEIVAKFVPIYREALAAHPDHPRLLWVVAAQQNYEAFRRGETSRDVPMATFEKGLALTRQEKVTDPLEPSWGEPEHLMSMAWMKLNQKPADLAAAESYAKHALAIVPHWHYVREILVKQIAHAKAKE